MSQQFHLYTRVFREHRFHAEFLAADDADLLVFHIVILDICFLEIAAFLFFIYDLCFVFAQLALNHFFHQIDGHVHIVAHLLGANDVALYRYRYFYLLSFFLYT